MSANAAARVFEHIAPHVTLPPTSCRFPSVIERYMLPDFHNSFIKAAGDNDANGQAAYRMEVGGVLSERANFSTSPLSRPGSLIHILANNIQDYLHFPNPDPLYIVLGCVAANMIEGPPVWIMLIGAPSSGRTILLDALKGLESTDIGAPGIKIVGGSIKGAGAFLSGTSVKEVKRNATGGLLQEIGTRGILVMKDFSSMLSMPKEPLLESIDVLRQAFDGFYSRPVGSDGGKHLKWEGRLGFIAASTPVIDQHMKLIGELGERWMYYRYEDSDYHGETLKALSIDNPGQMKQELRDLIANFFAALGIAWDEPRRSLTKAEIGRIYAMSSLTTAARSAVSRDAYHYDEVTDAPVKEGSPRFASQLGQLLIGLEAIGIDTDERWRLLGKMALDSVKRARMQVLLAVHRARRTVKVSEIRANSAISHRVLNTIIGDLKLHGVLEYVKKARGGADDGENGLRLTSWARERLELGFNGTSESLMQQYELKTKQD